MLVSFALYSSLARLVTALTAGAQYTFSPAQRCAVCPPPVERDTYCAAPFPSADNYSAPTEDAELIAVQLITRHGDRSPLVTKPYWDVTWDCAGERQFAFFSDNVTRIRPERAMITRELVSIPEGGPYSSSMWRGSCGVGQLTPRGAAYQRLLGTQLRKIYIEKLQFLPETLQDPTDIYVRSTAHRRTKQSASRILSGIYPDEFRPDGSVFDIVTLPSEIEYLHRNPDNCPAQVRIIRKIVKSNAFKSHMKKNKGLFKKLHAVFGPATTTYWQERSFLTYFEHLAPRVCHQMPIPCDKSLRTCLTYDDVGTAMRNAYWEMTYIFRDSPYSRQLNRLLTGSFLGELREKMKHHADSSIQGDQWSKHHEGRFEQYSAHDETLASLLGAFHVRKVDIPPYSSNMIIELWRSRLSNDMVRIQYPGMLRNVESRYDEFFLRILYNGKPLDVQWCDMNACSSRVIWENTKHLIPRKIFEECHEKMKGHT